MKVLFLAHNHPVLHPGGTEVFADRLRDALHRKPGTEVIFAATRTGSSRTDNAGTHFGAVEPGSDSVLLSGGQFDRDGLSQADTYGFLGDVERLAGHVKPDIVHFHHFLELGLEAVVSVLHGWPGAKIVMTLHDYYAICSNEGLLVKRQDGRVCQDRHPIACQRCFPDRTVESFRLRDLFVRAAFSRVDRFVAPSSFLREQFIAWGLDASRIVHIPNGHTGRRAATSAQRKQGSPVRFGFFGNFHRHKGILILLEAARHLYRTSVPFELHLHGFDGYSEDVTKTAVRSAEQEFPSTVINHGPYHAREASSLMERVDWVVVPSTWPENNPLVIQEALAAGRPILCSDCGGMAEHVKAGESGIHFRMGDAFDLARAMRAIADGTAEMAANQRVAPTVPSMIQCANQHMALYRSLMGPSRNTARRRRNVKRAPVAAAAE